MNVFDNIEQTWPLTEEITIKRGKPSLEFIKNYIIRYDNDFFEPLSDRVDISLLANKIANYPTLFVAFKNEIPVGIIASYFYEPESKIGFITLVHVDKKHRKKHLAKYLLEAVKEYAKQIGFNGIDLFVYKDNSSAFNLYSHYGFKILSEQAGRCHMRWTKDKESTNFSK